MKKILKKAGKDITSEFFSLNTVNFENGDYQKIRNYIDRSVSNLRCRAENRAAIASLGTSK